MPQPPKPVGDTGGSVSRAAEAKGGCPGCSSGADCIGKPGEDLYYDYYDKSMAYCNSCWVAEPEEAEAKPSDALAYCTAAGLPEPLAERVCKALRRDDGGEELPLLHRDVEVHAPLQPGGPEALVGSACLVLVDHRQAGKVGGYSLLAFLEDSDCGKEEPTLRLDIGPSTRLAAERDEAGGEEEDEADRRPAYRLTNGPSSWLLSFRGPVEARAFLRDFRVRSRVMKLALQVSRLSAESALLRQRAAGGVCKSVTSVLPTLVICGLAFGFARLSMQSIYNIEELNLPGLGR